MMPPNEKALVQQLAKTAKLGQGKTPAERSANAGIFTQTVAAALGKQDARWGVLAKPSGNNYQGYSVDCLAWRDPDDHTIVRLVDIVSASDGTDAKPAWQDAGIADVARWRMSPLGGAPVPEPEPPPSDADLIAALDRLTAAIARLTTLLEEGIQ